MRKLLIYSLFGATFITFLIIIGLAILTGLLNFIISLIPFLGVVLSMIVFAIFTGFVTIFLVRVYQEMDLSSDTSPEVEA